MLISWGANAQNGKPVIWDSASVVNPHIGLFGDTGMGKTRTMRFIVQNLLATAEQKIRFHVFDAHGDIEGLDASTVRFHESSDFGFNPLELNPDPEFGGVRKRVQSLITAINKTSAQQLGHRQERMLTRLLTALYRDHGFVHDDPSTWRTNNASRTRYPTLVDAIEYGREMRRALYTGSNQIAVRAFKDLSKIAKQIRAREVDLLRAGPDDPESKEKLQRDLESARERAVLTFTEAVANISSGSELDDAIETEGKEETLSAVIDRLENLYAIGIYRSTPPPLDPQNPVWRYDIAPLGDTEKKMFSMTRLETIFTRAVQRGQQKEIRDVILLDEAHLYQDKSDDYIINRMVRESRKFGVMMIFASQGLNDYPQPLLAGLGTKVILGIDHSYRRAATTKLGISETALDFIVPQRRIVVQTKNRGELTNNTNMVILNS